MMDMNNYRGESHVAQQSRRDKLRVQHQSEHLEDHNKYSNLEQQYQDHYQLRNVKYGTATPYANVFSSSDMMSYVVKKNWNNVLLPQNEQCLVSLDDKFSVANCGNSWKSVGTQHGYDWVANANGIQENNYSNNTLFIEGGVKGNNANTFYMKQQGSGYNGYGQDVVESSIVDNMSSETSLIHQNGIRSFGNNGSSSQFDYQNTLQGVVTTATVGGEGNHDVVGRYGGKDSNELLLLSSFGNASGNWVNRPNEEFRGVRDRRIIGDSTSNAQGLSLSLSSVPICSSTREGQYGGRNYSSDVVDTKGLMSSRNWIGSNCKGFGNSTHIPQRSGVGPLGPFTGYATILKNSKFLKPTLQLLDDLCGATRIDQSNEMYSDKMADDQEVVGVSCDRVGVDAGESMVIGTPRVGDQSGVSSLTFYSSNVISGEGGGRSSSNECYRPENHQKKAKLLYMQEEVCRRYKQYHQQMQMVVSSFESVAGLSAATPCISMALKTVSRHFRCLKHAITDQLRHMGKALGEDLSSPTTAGTSSSSKGDTNTTRLKYADYGFQKHKSGGSNQLVLSEPQPPVWRPQRGLPERAVAVLRAWLFDHFLHPYPTDTDKHVLATQTGLTRNQVSNWFINARVRVWKPMVEEIHILETKGSTEPGSQTGKVDENPSSDQNANHEYDNQPTSKLPAGFDPSRSRDAPNAEHWNQEKRSRVECQIPSANIDGPLVSFMPYQRGGLEIGAGLGAVSLTLGLRQSAETAQQQQQDHFRQTFGGQMVHDFVG